MKKIISIIFLLALMWVVSKFVSCVKNNGWHFQYNKERTSNIYSLRTSSEISGSFIIGIGSVGSEDYYVFYRKTASGGLIREKIKTSNCIIYEGYTNPKVTEVGEMGYLLQDGDTLETSFQRDSYNSKFHSIYVPKGTITERIDIDIK